MGMSKAIINIKDLSFSYRHQKVLDGIHTEIYEKKMTVILGRNGSGKSTLLRLLAGLLKSENDKILFQGVDINSLSLRKRAAIFGYLPQHHQAVFPFKVHEVVLTGRAGQIYLTPSSYDKEIAVHALEKTGILHLKDRYYTELSGGEQQLVMIARVLAQQPAILILDEPTSSLDFNNQAHILSILKKLTAEGLTIISVLHDPNAAILYGDEFLFLKKGKLIRPGVQERLWSKEFLGTLYETDVESIPYGDKFFVVPKTTAP